MTTAEESCPVCHGTGWQIRQGDNEREVVRCQCRVRDRGERLLATAHIPERYQHCEFGNFDCDHQEGNSIGQAKRWAADFVEKYPIDKKGLLLVGTVGVGKTHLAVAIIKALIEEKGVGCLFCDYRELLKSIQNSYNTSVRATEMEILRPVFDVELLVLDELGAARSTEWVFDTVNYLLNSRYNNNKTTIITTNYVDAAEQDKLPDDDPVRAARAETLGDRIGQRMWSRLHEMCKKVEIKGKDYRVHGKRR
ncbi:MAG: ATP-binding protein [Candidatus Korobacteraceae bacterium]